MKQIRQGDVLLEKVDRLPPKEIKPQREVVLAEGELTGHAHRVKSSAIYDWSEDNQRYIMVKGEGELFHEDHDPVPAKVLEPNTTWRVIPQKEWNLEGQWRRVID